MADKIETIKNKIASKLQKNELIHDTSHLAVDIKTTGFLFWSKNTIYVRGRVNTDREKEEIMTIVEQESNGYAIENDLRVDRR